MEISKPGADLLGDARASLLLALSRLTRGVSGREAARLAGVKSQATSQRELAKLVAIGLVTVQPSPPASLYALNRSHVLWGPVREILASPTKVRDVIREVVERHTDGQATAALFGSVARGTSTTASDIDLLLVVPDAFVAEARESLIDELNEKVASFTGNPLQLFAVSRSEVATMNTNNDPLLRSWLDDARTLTGEDLSSIVAATR